MRFGTRWAKRLGAALLLPLFWGVEPGLPQTRKKAPSGDVPMQISAARLEADQKERLIVFSGQVKAQYGDSVLYADQLRVYYQAGPPAAGATAPTPQTKEASPLGELGGEKIDRIVAQGQVRFVQEDKVATAQEATYYKNREEIIMVGQPQVWQGENSLKGDKIIFNLADNRMRVESSPQKRVEANLYPRGGAASGEKIPLPGLKSRKEDKARRP